MARNDSGAEWMQNKVHGRQNCAGDFNSLARQLTDHLLNGGKYIALQTIAQCIQARLEDSKRYGEMNEAHRIPYLMVSNLHELVATIPDGMRATVDFMNNPFRVWVQLETGQVATVTADGIFQGRFARGGRRKSTRKQRKTKRHKTYRR